jgi:ABC-type transport system involved in multi-copper enzyme maturation permease subunit
MPRASRTQLIVAKFVVVTALILIAIISSSLIWGVGRGIAAGVAGVAYGPEVTGTAVVAFIKEYLLTCFTVSASVLIGTAIAALIAMYTRSILTSLFLAIGYAIVEPVVSLLLLLTGAMFERPAIINLVRFTPSYNLDNVSNWIMNEGSSFGTSNLPGFTTDFSGGTSLLMVGLWLGGLLLLTLWLFSRQDISE